MLAAATDLCSPRPQSLGTSRCAVPRACGPHCCCAAVLCPPAVLRAADCAEAQRLPGVACSSFSRSRCAVPWACGGWRVAHAVAVLLCCCAVPTCCASCSRLCGGSALAWRCLQRLLSPSFPSSSPPSPFHSSVRNNRGRMVGMLQLPRRRHRCAGGRCCNVKGIGLHRQVGWVAVRTHAHIRTNPSPLTHTHVTAPSPPPPHTHLLYNHCTNYGMRRCR